MPVMPAPTMATSTVSVCSSSGNRGRCVVLCQCEVVSTPSLMLAAARTLFFSAAVLFVHGCPSALLCGVGTDSAFLVTFLDVRSLAFLFAGVGAFVALWHGNKSWE